MSTEFIDLVLLAQKNLVILGTALTMNKLPELSYLK